MSLSDEVRALENAYTDERKKRRELEDALGDVRDVLAGYNGSNTKPWGRTLDKIGRLVGVEVRH